MKKVLFLVLIALVFPGVAFARPATEPTPANKLLIQNAYEVIHERFHVDDPVWELDWDDPRYPAVRFFITKDLLKNKGMVLADGSLQKNDFVNLLNGLQADMQGSSTNNWTVHEIRKIVRKLEDVSDTTFCDAIHDKKEEILPFVISSGCTPASILQNVYEWLPYEYKYPQVSFDEERNITLDNDVIYYNGNPIKGIFVNWSIKPSYEKRYMEEEIVKMKEMGIVGISTEIGWEEVEKRDDDYDFPRYFDSFLDLAEHHGLYVNILLSGHYTPKWVMNKYGDIRMYTDEGKPVYDGSYMTFAPTSPALADLKEFQAKAIEHYEEFPNVIAFFLSNEQSYGNKARLDYSSWAETAWRQYREDNALEPYDQPMPRSDYDPEFVHWQRFRQEMLLNYLNELYDNAADARSTFIPVGHKTIFYEATSAYSKEYGIYPAPSRLRQDIVGSDIYGYTPNVYPVQNAFGKPIFVIEANLPYEWDADSMFKYLVMHYYNRMPMQTIFQWNEGTHPNVMFYPGGTWWNKTWGIKRAIDFINTAEIPEYPANNIAVVLPRNALAKDGHLFEVFQYVFDDIIWDLEKHPEKHPIILWSDEVSGDVFDETIQKLVADISEIVIITSSLDHPERGEAIKEWERNGGTIIIK